jgi:tetratricopeptide (TPR) repeat protein
MKLKATIAGVLALMISFALYGQIGQGGIRGKVLDREGKPLQGAVLRIEHLTTHQTDDVKSNRNGDYSITGLYNGQYKVTIIVDGRAVMVRGEGAGNSIYVVNGVDATVNFDLRNAPAVPPPTPAAPSAAAAPRDDKAIEEAKKKQEELKGAFSAGIAALNAKNYDEAIRQFQLAAEKDATQPNVFGNLGLALYNAKKYDDAVEAYKKSIALKADDPAIHLNLGLALASSGKIEDATKAVEEVAKLNPALAGQGYYSLGAILTNRGRSKEAVEAFNKAIEIDPRNGESYYQIGIAYFGDAATISRAVTALQKYLEMSPAGPNAEAAKALIEAAKAQAPANYAAPGAQTKQQKR